MGSIGQSIECPNCGAEAHNEYYYKTGEESIFCMHCGYSHSAFYKTDENGKFVRENGELVLEEKEIKNPYGVLSYAPKGSGVTGFITIKSQEHLDELLSEFDKAGVLYDLTLKRWINGKHQTGIILGKNEKRN